VFVCYIPGLDARRIDAQRTPYISELRSDLPVVNIRTLPSTELVPTLLSGTLPHEHRVWQVSLRPEIRAAVAKSVGDYLPDFLVTTLQCARHFFEPTYDLAVIPRRRRRRFQQHRFKYTRRAASDESTMEFTGYRSILGLLGEQSKYIFTKDFGSLPKLLEGLPTDGRVLEFLEMYALDLVQHWHLDNDEVMADALWRTDGFVRDLHSRCRKAGRRFVLLVDHGQERVIGTVPLLQALRQSGVPETEYSYFIELASARLWCHTERARRNVLDALRSLPHTTVLDWRDMHEFGVCFEDDSFGEFYVFADAGWIHFPHDFYHPLGNIILGLLDAHQRQRITNPVHRGNHGYLPHYASEQGWLLMDDNRLQPSRRQAELIDVAPSLLSILGVDVPAYMKGTPLFESNG